jgi:hypothetical protein
MVQGPGKEGVSPTDVTPVSHPRFQREQNASAPAAHCCIFVTMETYQLTANL